MAFDLDLGRRQTISSTQYAIAWTALMIWDVFVLFPMEVRHIWFARLTPTKVVYLLTRYGTLLFQVSVVALNISTISIDTCSKIFWIQASSLAYALFISDVLLSLRVYALYGRSQRAMIALGILLATELAFLVACASQVGHTILPPQISNAIGAKGCIAGSYVGQFDWFPKFCVAVPAIVNFALLAATTYKSWRVTKDLEGLQLPILKRFLRDGVLYFLGITIACGPTVYFFSQPNPVLKTFNLCAGIVVSSTLACRLTLSLYEPRPMQVHSLISVAEAGQVNRERRRNTRWNVTVVRSTGE